MGESADPLDSILGPDEMSGHFFAEAFEQTSARWDALYDPAQLLDADTDFVLRMMMSRVAETAAGGTIIEDGDPRLSAVLSVGLGGYAWRAAEQAIGRGVGSEILDGIHEAIAFYEDERTAAGIGASPRQDLLYQASARALSERIPLWYTTPGYRGWGLDLFRAGQQFVVERVAEHTDLDAGDLFYAFSFGVALRHVEAALDAPDAPVPGAWSGPEWKLCEIVLRPDNRAFIAEADGHVVATSGSLPDFRRALPRFLDRRSTAVMERHAELVRALEQDGWERLAASGSEWWSARFRRREPN